MNFKEITLVSLNIIVRNPFSQGGYLKTVIASSWAVPTWLPIEQKKQSSHPSSVQSSHFEHCIKQITGYVFIAQSVYYISDIHVSTIRLALKLSDVLDISV